MTSRGAPSEARVCIDFCNAATKRRRPDGSFMSMEEADAAFSRFIESVRQKERERIQRGGERDDDRA